MRHDCRRWTLRGAPCPHAELRDESAASSTDEGLGTDFDAEIPKLTWALYGAKTYNVRLGEQLSASALIADAAIEGFAADSREWKPAPNFGPSLVPWTQGDTPAIPFHKQTPWRNYALIVLALGAAAVLGLTHWVPGAFWPTRTSLAWRSLLTTAYETFDFSTSVEASGNPMHGPPTALEGPLGYYDRITSGTEVDPVSQPTTWYAP